MTFTINDLLIYIILIIIEYELSEIYDKINELLKKLTNNNLGNKDEELGKEKNHKT